MHMSLESNPLRYDRPHDDHEAIIRNFGPMSSIVFYIFV